MPLPDDMPIGAGSGGAPASHLPDGSYYVALLDIRARTRQRGQFANPCKDHKGDQTTPSSRPESPRCERCQYPDDLREVFEFWFKEQTSGDTFTFESGQSTHEKSKLVTTISPALGGGIQAGDQIKGRSINVMIGRTCLGQIKANAKGYAKLVNLMPMPGGQVQTPTPAAQGPELDSYGNPVEGYEESEEVPF